MWSSLEALIDPRMNNNDHAYIGSDICLQTMDVFLNRNFQVKSCISYKYKTRTMELLPRHHYEHATEQL